MDRATVYQVVAAVRRRWPLALLILVVVLGVDIAFTTTRQRTYLARAAMVVSPSATVDRGQLVYSVDSLGRGRIIGTFAEVLGSDVVQREVASRLNLPATPPSESPGAVLQRTVTDLIRFVAPGQSIPSESPDTPSQWVVVKSSVIADSAVIQILAESPDPAMSADAANIAGEIGITQLSNLYPVYALTFLSRAEPPTSPYRPDVLRNYALGVLVGLALAVVASYLLDLALQGRRESGSARPAAGTSDVSAMGPVAAPGERMRYAPPHAASGAAFTSVGATHREGPDAHPWRNDATPPVGGEPTASYPRTATRDA
jgi:capsular polysaccharide biosynthesis protein